MYLWQGEASVPQGSLLELKKTSINTLNMATKPFHYQEMFPLGPDTTEYYHLTSDYVRTENWGGVVSG